MSVFNDNSHSKDEPQNSPIEREYKGTTKRRVGRLLGERQRNLSKLLGATPSTTSNIEILRIEAQQATEATDEDLEDRNPHIPSNDDVLKTAIEVTESAGLTPAWEVVDGGTEVNDE